MNWEEHLKLIRETSDRPEKHTRKYLMDFFRYARNLLEENNVPRPWTIRFFDGKREREVEL